MSHVKLFVIGCKWRFFFYITKVSINSGYNIHIEESEKHGR